MKKSQLFLAIFALLCGCNTVSNNNQQTVNDVDSSSAAVESSVLGEDNLTTVRYLDTLPAEYNEDDLFGFILSYGGVHMMVGSWQMPDGDWLIIDHWCEEEDNGMYYMVDAEGNEVEVEYKDPFEGQPYPVVHNPHFLFVTRNYGGETINFYKTANSQEVACATDYKEITLHVLGVDPKTRRILVQSVPTDWCWGKPADEMEAEYRHPFVELRGWIDEEWVCANTVTTCS